MNKFDSGVDVGGRRTKYISQKRMDVITYSCLLSISISRTGPSCHVFRCLSLKCFSSFDNCATATRWCLQQCRQQPVVNWPNQRFKGDTLGPNVTLRTWGGAYLFNVWFPWNYVLNVQAPIQDNISSYQYRKSHCEDKMVFILNHGAVFICRLPWWFPTGCFDCKKFFLMQQDRDLDDLELLHYRPMQDFEPTWKINTRSSTFPGVFKHWWIDCHKRFFTSGENIWDKNHTCMYLLLYTTARKCLPILCRILDVMVFYGVIFHCDIAEAFQGLYSL